jgi:hypothetical protein
MEERDHQLPVATLRPRRLPGRLVAWRGDSARWLRGRSRAALQGRHAPLLLTGIVFSAMMLTMGYVADRAHHAGAAIDEVHRHHRAWSQRQRPAVVDVEIASHAAAAALDDPWAAAGTRAPTALFYVRPR